MSDLLNELHILKLFGGRKRKESGICRLAVFAAIDGRWEEVSLTARMGGDKKAINLLTTTTTAAAPPVMMGPTLKG